MTEKDRIADDLKHSAPPLKDERVSHYECPACGHRLRDGIEIRHGGVNWFVVYCHHGPCKSYVANEGGTGATVDEAYNNLVKKMDGTQEQRET